MTVYYTGKGDEGETGTIGKGRIKKDSKLAVAMGDIDELNSIVGVAVANTPDERINSLLRVIQDRLFMVGAELSASLEGGAKLKFALKDGSTKDLEKEIEELGSRLPELKKFVLPGGSLSASYLHLARAAARRAERSVVALSSENKINPALLQYLNRLSSFFFVAALYMNKKEGIEEFNPTYSG
ncbi:MAG: cob(I)yrinic acid a,c-diamide adenosyltransferase [Candidatus Micrarchaeales archaeon]|nr:cob(I)yrinic acid a,c-diamide adenosyltransferase [Candidatus Micrarchaeales archaeon]